MATVSMTVPQPLHAPDGKVFAYFVSADEFDRQRAELAELRRMVGVLKREAGELQLQLARAANIQPLPPMTDEEIRTLGGGPHESLDEVLATLDDEAGHGTR